MSNDYYDGTDSKVPPETKELVAISALVHGALRKLKMGEKAYISCDKHPVGDVANYLRAYAFHKEKWFDTTYDATSKVLTAVRSAPPPWDDLDDELDDPDEE
jgi:hypothetical protein